MNTRTAMLLAADSIENHPELFDYNSTLVPDDCGTPGCAFGWIAFHFGYKSRHEFGGFSELAEKHGIAEPIVFYLNMTALNFDWDRNPKLCATTLRLYADQYHGIPESVRSIFYDNVPAELRKLRRSMA